MPAFTAVGAYVAGTLLGLVGTAALVVGTIVAVGAAYVTSRVINGNPNKGANSAQNQGGRIQVPPATNNKIPVLYGNAYVNGIITDARLTNENKTMYYCIVLSETCNVASAAYTLNNVYWNDLRLTAVDSTTNAHKIKDGRKTVDGPGEDFIDTNFIVNGNSLVEVRVYAGSSAAADQIYPTQASGNTQNAYAFWPDSDWTSANQMTGLVFAIVKVTYNGEKGFTALPNMTFQLNNNVDNPAAVWYDYMTSSRYGANINPATIDTTPVTSALAVWEAYCDDLITYTPIGGGSTTQKRYTINGLIDTSTSVKENIDTILQNGAAWLSYNVSSGQWEPIVKKAATAGELSAALQFSDDNIISGISISSTRLEDLYNKLEVEFYDKYNKDQKAYARLNLDAGLRNPNEPDNQLRMNLDLVNNSVQAELIGQIELRQSRDDLVVEFTTNHYGIQAQAGDVIGITSELYGWAPKYFRVMRVKEIEAENGTLVAQIQALEYNADVYTVEPITEFTTEANIGIGVYGASPNLPEPPRVFITELDTNVPVPFFNMQIQIPSDGGPYDEIEMYFTEGWDPMDITGFIDDNSTPGTYSGVPGNILTVTATPYGSLHAGDYFDLGGVSIVEQLTNNPASKTFASGGAVATNTVTLNNTTGLLIGNKLTGTGLPTTGASIISIAGSEVTLDNYFTAQAAGTYLVTGGLGTYTVNTTTATSGTDTIYDLPLDSDYKYLRKVVPEGNAPTFVNGETITVTITEVPANSQTYRRWFVKTRLGIKKNFGRFSQPGVGVDYDRDGNFQYEPSPVGGGSLNDLADVTLTNPELGDFLWYDGTKWINENEPSVDTRDRTLRLSRTSDTAGEDYEDTVVLRLNDRITDTNSYANDEGGPAIRFERSSGTVYTKTYVSGGAPGATTVTLNNVTSLVVGHLVTGTGLPTTGALITNIAGNQITLNTAFTVQAAGNYSTGTPIAFGQMSMEWFGTDNVHKFKVVTSTDAFDPGTGSPPPYPNTTTLITSTKNATDINEGVLYVDAVNNRVGVNITTPQTDFHVAGSVLIDDNLHVSGDALVDDNLTVTGSTFLGNDYLVDVVNVIGEFDVTNNSISNLFVDHTTGYVGINDNTPSYNLDVNGTANIETSLTVPSISTLTGDDLNITAFSGRNVTISVTNSTDPVTLVRNTTVTNDSTATLTLRTNSTGTPVVGFGNFLEFETESTPGTFVRSGYINNKSTGDNAGVLDEFSMGFGVMSAGTSVERMALDNLGNLQIDGDLQVDGDDIKKSGGITVVTFSGTNLTTFAGDIAIGGNTIRDSASTAAIELSGADVNVQGDLTVTGNDIKSSTATAITLSGSDVAVVGGLNVDSGTLYVDKTTNRVGVNNTSPTQALDVTGNIEASGDIDAGGSLLATNRVDVGGSLILFSTGFGPSVETQTINDPASGTSLQTVDSWATISYRTAKYTISMRKGTDYHSMEIMVLHDDTTAYMNTYSEIFTNASLATFTVDISSGQVRLRVTPATVGTLEIVLERKLFVAI